MVKYADGPSAAVEVQIAAPPAVVWPLVCDIELPARFSPEFQGADWVGDGPGLGATFQGRNKHKSVGEWTTTSTITAFDVDHVFEWTVGDLENKTARWRFDLAPEADGSTLRFSAEMGPGPSGLSLAINAMPEREEEIVARRLGEWVTNMTATLDGIRVTAEDEVTAEES